MADQSSFTSDEWTLLLESPMLAGLAVTAAEPSGIFGTIKESFSAASAIAHAKTDAATNPLIKAVADAYGTSEGRTAARDGLGTKLKGKKPAEMKEAAIGALGQVAALLSAKAPADAAAFKAWLNGIAQKAAEAASEGGFLGFGGVKVSDAEKATLGEIATVLG
ncbi:MAG: hypothetical protein U1E45_01830 [Geminicoccaceae bacterium]